LVVVDSSRCIPLGQQILLIDFTVVCGTVFAIYQDRRITMNTTRPVALCLLFIIIALHTAAPAHAGDRLQAEKLFVEAQKALSRGEMERAESLLKEALAADPSFTSSIWQLAQIYEKKGMLEHARELLIRGLQQEPDATWAREKLAALERALTQKLLRNAQSYMESGEYDLAIPKLSLYLGIKPYDPIPLLMIGRCHLALGNLDTAKEYLLQASERDPSNRDVSSLIAEVDRRIERGSVGYLVKTASSILKDNTPDRKAEAVKALEAVLSADPENDWANEKLAELRSLEDAPEPHLAEETSAKNDENGALTALSGVKGFLTSNAFAILMILCLAALSILIVLVLRKRPAGGTYPLSGSLALVPIIDVVALLNSNLRTGQMVLKTARGSGEICFENGEIIHARWKGTDGKKAFGRIMNQRSGTYTFTNKPSGSKRTISEPLSVLLLFMNRNEESPADLLEKSARESEKLFTT
jgi:tetratricopeptide (TPR) repeat protein